MKRTIALITASALLSACAAVPGQLNAGPSGGALPYDITLGQAKLAAKVYPKLAAQADPNANLFISPLSLSEGLGLAVVGARGQTDTELRGLLGWDATTRPELGIADYDRFLTNTDDDKVAISVANALWLSDDLQFKAEYLDTAKQGFAATVQDLNFGGNPQGSADTINEWVANETRERITEIVKPSGFDDSTAAVLTNAVWFKADWTNAFEDGAMGVFTKADGSKTPIYLMERIGSLAYRQTPQGQAVALPYGKTERFVMEVFLPKDAAALREWERDLDALSFCSGVQGCDGQFDLSTAPTTNIILRLPRFEARFDESMKDAMMAAGISCSFTAACADFANMANAPLKIDDVAHATFLRVDEEGTEAAAVTAVKIVVTSGAILPDLPQMIVDRPFLLTIRDRASGALIFFGRIGDPMAIERSSG